MNRFSLLVAAYNMQDYLEECLESCVSQDYPEECFEVICVNDGSTDRSLNIIEKFAEANVNFRFISQENQGLEKTCNQAISMAGYEWLVRVDADDKMDLNFLKVMNAAIKKQQDFDFYYCGDYVEYYSDSEFYVKSVPPFDKDEIYCRGDFFATGTAYKKKDLAEIGNFPTDVKNCGLENYSVILNLLDRNKTGLAVSGASFNYRRHHTNMSLVKRTEIIEFGKQLLKKHGRIFVTNENHPYGLVLS